MERQTDRWKGREIDRKIERKKDKAASNWINH
jgi:hypothetical protein